jgi:hypothetical protein
LGGPEKSWQAVSSLTRRRMVCHLSLFLMTCSALTAQTNSPAPKQMPIGAPRNWVQSAVDNELPIINISGAQPLRYRIHKTDTKGDTVRIQIESRQGDVARLVERNGHSLTSAENAAEIARLQDVLASPQNFMRHHKHDTSTRSDVTQLVRLMPQAMLFAYTPGQPQRTGAQSPQVVIDFHSDPAFKPPTMLSQSLTGIEGRMWIDAESRHLIRIEGHFLKQVDFGYGIVARIYPGGTIELDQVNAGNGRWAYSRLVEDLTVRAMMVKTIPQKSEMEASDFHLLPAPIDFQEAVRQLLALPISTQ